MKRLLAQVSKRTPWNQVGHPSFNGEYMEIRALDLLLRRLRPWKREDLERVGSLPIRLRSAMKARELSFVSSYLSSAHSAIVSSLWSVSGSSSGTKVSTRHANYETVIKSFGTCFFNLLIGAVTPFPWYLSFGWWGCPQTKYPLTPRRNLELNRRCICPCCRFGILVG